LGAIDDQSKYWEWLGGMVDSRVLAVGVGEVAGGKVGKRTKLIGALTFPHRADCFFGLLGVYM
jgi:hypothetical protein